jgi:hypothetical protein
VFRVHVAFRKVVYTLGMEKHVIDLTSVLSREHEKKWVALSKDNKCVVDYDESLIELGKRVDKRQVTFMKAPPTDVYLCF